MKKILIATNLLTIMAVGYFSCTGKNSPKPICASNYTCYDTSFTNKPFDGVEATLVEQMLRLYKQNHWDSIRVNNLNDSIDSRWVWFSFSRLKQFIYDVEKNACAKGCNSNTELGVRMYYTEYPDASKWSQYPHLDSNNVPKSFQKRHTLLLVPTYSSGGMNIDFDPRNDFINCNPPDFSKAFDNLIGQGDRPKINFYGMLPTITQNQLRRSTPGNPSSPSGIQEQLGVMNRGTMAPPPTDDEIGGKRVRFCMGSLLLDRIDGITCGNGQVAPPGPDKKD